MTRRAISMHVPERLDRLPGELAARQPQFLQRTADLMAAEVARQAPGGPRGSLGRSYHGVLVGREEAAVVSNHPGAKALDKGAYIRARHAGRGSRRPVIRFQGSDGPVYRTAVRIKAHRYTTRAAGKRRRILEQAFESVYGNL